MPCKPVATVFVQNIPTVETIWLRAHNMGTKNKMNKINLKVLKQEG